MALEYSGFLCSGFLPSTELMILSWSLLSSGSLLFGRFLVDTPSRLIMVRTSDCPTKQSNLTCYRLFSPIVFIYQLRP
ncbi:uncharacterized protein BO96DRAFT_74944 [Aspergillus niger CBS 101883]|uniref:uncharacterized protein n=1 Tax=Aspergillus lacticoffeatus (strain CBS 101883) TaxID=1450533 RepID=UPI000D7EE3B1|nr:uncharacterized protein BO96DRAFT_74944 [Aspergillus niger CBS 101883]PYH55380.1 hypothetical protein BO96DRAFT_74944 [Aspergillus niger CBS 101883]